LWDRGIFLLSKKLQEIIPHLKVDIQEDPSRENGESSPLEKNLSGLMGVSGRGN